MVNNNETRKFIFERLEKLNSNDIFNDLELVLAELKVKYLLNKLEYEDLWGVLDELDEHYDYTGYSNYIYDDGKFNIDFVNAFTKYLKCDSGKLCAYLAKDFIFDYARTVIKPKVELNKFIKLNVETVYNDYIDGKIKLTKSKANKIKKILDGDYAIKKKFYDDYIKKKNDNSFLVDALL